MPAYDAFKGGVAWVDLSARGRLVATGEDRVRLIHAISSNDIEGLAAGEGAYAFFLNPQGRIQADSHVFVHADRIVIHCEPGVRASLQGHIENYIIMDDVAVEDVTATTTLLAVAGPEAGATVAGLDARMPAEPLSFAAFGSRTIYRVPVGGVDGCWIAAPVGEKEELIDALERLGAIAASAEECDAYRVRNRIPRFGSDFNSTNIPHETQQLHAVSFSKGCYTGQEIVERVRSQAQVKRLLVGIELDSPELPSDLTVRHADSPVGTLTSPTRGALPGCKAAGFALVRTVAAAPGTRVEVGGIPATVLDLARE